MNVNYTPLDKALLEKRHVFHENSPYVFWTIVGLTLLAMGGMLFFLAIKYHAL